MTLLEKLKRFYSDLVSLKKLIRKEKAIRISKKHLRETAEEIGSRWFSDLNDEIVSRDVIKKELIDDYSKNFEQLIKISASNNLKSSYTETLNNLSKKFRNDIILTFQKIPETVEKSSELKKMLANLPNSDEDEYLKEAINCAVKKYYRAAAVLGWCAAIDKVHRTIEKNGFVKFNIVSVSMASQTKGRFKKFKSPQNIGSISELREVFDTNILWILEGMQLIDSNQHTRLKGCFDLRCQCAHPGDAPVTKYNLLSFFSDLNEIVFRNSKFNIQ